MGSDIWKLFAPSIVKYVETLLREGKIGICSGTIRVTDVKSSCHANAKTPNGDRFKLIIPYAGHSVTWEVLFNCRYPDEPPDFIFNNGDPDFEPDIEQIVSLVKWDPTDSAALLHVVQELLREYKLHQESLISRNSRLQFEYTSLLDNGYKSEDIEIHVTRKSDNRMGPINFLVNLAVDFTRIPPFFTQDNPGEDTAVLLATFQTADGAKVSPQLYLSPRVEHTFGGPSHLRIPPFPNGGCLLDYVPNICELLTNKIDQICTYHEKRKEYVGAFLSNFGRSVIEYDQENFSNISLLLEWHNFYFSVLIDLPKKFPMEQPIFSFCSVYHESHDGSPYRQEEKSYPYSPRWSGNEMAERARAYILEYITQFQRASVSGGQIGH